MIRRRQSWLVLVVTALLAVLGMGRPLAAAGTGEAQISTIAAPSTPGALRGGPDHRAHTPQGDARDGEADALPPSGSFELSSPRRFVLAAPVVHRDVRFAQAPRGAALPRGPPSFV